jgi:sugar phosphate isomerase/epimerase
MPVLNVKNKTKPYFRVGVDNYSLNPLELDPMDTLQWALDHQADGIQFSGLSPRDQPLADKGYLKDLSQFAESNNLYLEWGGGQHIPYDLQTWKKKDILPENQRVAEQAGILGTRIIRSCSGGLMRWNSSSPSTETLLKETALTLKSQKKMLQDHNVLLAIETHFEFTTHELLVLFDMCEAEPGDYLGIDLDTMNLLIMLEDPLMGTERILPWVVATHIKDGGLICSDEGFIAFPAEIGKGFIPLMDILKRLKSLDRNIHLSIEDHGGQFNQPIFDPEFLSKFPDLTVPEFSRLIRTAHRTSNALDEGKWSITDRDDWPAICETRLDRDIKTLRKMVKSLEGEKSAV